jgi:hypothetical protein
MPTPVVPDRTCGRCRQPFPGDPDNPVDAQVEWWLCTPCRAVLLQGPKGFRVPPGGSSPGPG